MKIFTATPKAFLTNRCSDDSFFSRDMGLTCCALQKAGVESKVVLLDGPDVKPHPDIIRASLEQMESVAWWKQFNLDAVVLCAWVAPRYTPIAKAIKESGAKLIVRCDSGEPYSQWQKTVWQSFYSHYLFARYAGKGWAPACGISLLRTPLFYVPAVYENRVLKHLAQADLILNETPEGVRLLNELLKKKGRADIATKVRYVLHPITDDAGYDGAVEKKKWIVAVGRWDNYQKNAPLLIQTLGKVLAEHPDYEAHLFGGGESTLRKLTQRLPANIQSRMVIRGIVGHAALIHEYQKSRILFMPSRSEGCAVAAEEALTCGCSVVGGARLLCMLNFASKNSGTLAHTYNIRSMADALRAEVSAWEGGARVPVRISQMWRREMDTATLSSTILNSGEPHGHNSNNGNKQNN